MQKYSDRTNIKWPNNRIRQNTSCVYSLRVLIFFSILNIFINPLHSAFPQTPDPLLQKLDSRYYYPSQLGLKKLTAKVKWLQKDLASSQLNFISHPEILFSWNVKSGERRFQIDPRLKELTETRRKEIKNFFLNYQEIILPRSLGQTLSGFKFNGEKKSSSQTIAEYQSPRGQDANQKYILEIDSEHWRISRFNIQRKNPPYNVISHFKYLQKEGQWLVSETLARFDLGRDSYSETTSYSYQKVMGFWLPVKINQVFKKGHDEVHTYRFLFSDYQIN